MLKELLIGITFGVIGTMGMLNCCLPKFKNRSKDNDEEYINEDLEDEDENDVFYDAESRRSVKIIKEDPNDIIIERRLKSTEDTIQLLMKEIASIKRSRTKNRISIQINQKSPNTHSCRCYQATTPMCSAFIPTESSPLNEVPRPPPPTPPTSTINDFKFPPSPTPPSPPSPPSPPPLPPIMTTGTASIRRSEPDKKALKTYGRIPITEEILKSVILKPPGQRMAGRRVLT